MMTLSPRLSWQNRHEPSAFRENTTQAEAAVNWRIQQLSSSDATCLRNSTNPPCEHASLAVIEAAGTRRMTMTLS